jgi:phosphatidylglycerol:prolipoprotein diacylglycerol transferase
MRQVLFWIPIRTEWTPNGIPIYGFGLMLFLAFVACMWLAGRKAEKEGIAKERLQDLAIWIFVGGILGARLVYMLQYGRPWSEFFQIWQGGLVFYGSAIGGVAGYFLGYFLIIRRYGLSSWKVADIAAPAAALGLCIGRIGCLLNGCCYGNVACPDCPSQSFPLHSPAWVRLVEHGYQTPAGFTLQSRPGQDRLVAAVEADSAAAAAGLKPGDEIVKLDDQPVQSSEELFRLLTFQWPRGKTDMTLTVLRDGQPETLGPFAPRTLGLHPTQIYESVSTLLLFLLLMAYYPLKRRDGEVMVLFMLGYSVHRFLNEMLRNDTDPIGWTGMTLSQNGSILVFVAAILMGLYLWRRPVQYQPVMV